MSDEKKENQQESKQEVKVEDLPVEETKQDQVKGGATRKTDYSS